MILLKKVVAFTAAVCMFALAVPGCAPAERPADDANDRTNLPNDMYAPNNQPVPDSNDTGLERTGNRWNDWMGQDRYNDAPLQPTSKNNRTR